MPDGAYFPKLSSGIIFTSLFSPKLKTNVKPFHQNFSALKIIFPEE